MITLVLSFQREKGQYGWRDQIQTCSLGISGLVPFVLPPPYPKDLEVQRKGGGRVLKDHILDLQWIKELVRVWRNSQLLQGENPS